MAAIEVENLTKIFEVYKKQPGFWGSVQGLAKRTYEKVYAVKDISFKIEEGEFVGFLGPNGAGKTTTLKMLAGLLYPSEGKASVFGFVPWDRPDAYRRQFALLLGQKNQLWWDLPALESLELNSKIYGIPRAKFEKTVKEMSALLRVEEKLNVMVRELSLGERMKMELIASLLHGPRVLFLDEPTIGLDVVSQKSVREFLKSHNREHKTTIILTSHYMADIQELCDRVIIIDKGVIFFDGQLATVLDQFADYKIIRVQWNEVPGKQLSEFENVLSRAGDLGEVVEKGETGLTLRVKRDRVIATCKILLDEFPISDIDIQEVPIEEIIRKIFAR